MVDVLNGFFWLLFLIWRLKRAWTARQKPGAIGRFAAAFDCLADAPKLPLWIRGPWLQFMDSSLESQMQVGKNVNASPWDLETWLPIPCLDYKAMENQFNQKEECKCRIIVECLPICSHCCPSLLSRPVCRVALSTGGNAWVVPWDYRSGTHFSRGNNLCHLCNIQTVTIANPPRPSKILFLSSGWQR